MIFGQKDFVCRKNGKRLEEKIGNCGKGKREKVKRERGPEQTI